jgi:hypothetical protein
MHLKNDLIYTVNVINDYPEVTSILQGYAVNHKQKFYTK